MQYIVTGIVHRVTCTQLCREKEHHLRTVDCGLPPCLSDCSSTLIEYLHFPFSLFNKQSHIDILFGFDCHNPCLYLYREPYESWFCTCICYSWGTQYPQYVNCVHPQHLIPNLKYLHLCISDVFVMLSNNLTKEVLFIRCCLQKWKH